jgi:hypothetical protein
VSACAQILKNNVHNRFSGPDRLYEWNESQISCKRVIYPLGVTHHTNTMDLWRGHYFMCEALLNMIHLSINVEILTDYGTNGIWTACVFGYLTS